MPVIEVNDLQYAYDEQPVLEDISLVIARGEYLGIIGPNGGGKTTLIKLILGLLSPKQGTIKLFGQPQTGFKDYWRIGYVPQRISQETNRFPITAGEVVASGLTRPADWQRIFRDPQDPQIIKIMTIAGIDHLKDRRLDQLSGGQRQRVFIARALVSQPEILILDEPTVGVDLASQESFYQFLNELNQRGMTIIFVSHDVEVIGNQAKKVLCVNRQLVCHGSPKEFIKPEFLTRLYGKQVKHIIHHH